MKTLKQMSPGDDLGSQQTPTGAMSPLVTQ